MIFCGTKTDVPEYDYIPTDTGFGEQDDTLPFDDKTIKTQLSVSSHMFLVQDLMKKRSIW